MTIRPALLRRLVIAATASISAFLCATATPAAQDTIVYGYLPYWEYEPADAPWEELTHIAIFSVGMTAEGTLTHETRWTGRAEEAVRLGREHGVKVHLCVTNFNDSQQYAVLSDPVRRAAAIERLAGLVDAYGADGVNVDFEGVGARSRDLLVTFVEELKAEVDEVFLAAPFVDWSDAWDYGRLTAVSDGLFIMAYEAHGSWGDAGPNVPLFESGRWGFISLEWTVNDYLSGGADLDKVIVGLPLYGHAWNVGSATSVPPTTSSYDRVLFYRDGEIARFGRRFDEASHSTYFAEGSTVQGWIDDAQAVLDKLEWIVDESGTGGIGFWALGYDNNDPLVWDYIASLNSDEPDPPVPPEDSFAAEFVGVSQGGVITLSESDAVELWVDVRNVGSLAWSPTTTRLAPLPRDAGSPLQDPTWLSSSRIAGVSSATAPGEVGRFQFVVRAPGAGSYDLRLGMVEEGVVWFADDGGPEDGFVTFPFAVTASGADVAPDVGGAEDVGPSTDVGLEPGGEPDVVSEPDAGAPDLDFGGAEIEVGGGVYSGQSSEPVTVRGCASGGRGPWPLWVLLLVVTPTRRWFRTARR